LVLLVFLLSIHPSAWNRSSPKVAKIEGGPRCCVALPNMQEKAVEAMEDILDGRD
jgi:hypothetical protein